MSERTIHPHFSTSHPYHEPLYIPSPTEDGTITPEVAQDWMETRYRGYQEILTWSAGHAKASLLGESIFQMVCACTYAIATGKNAKVTDNLDEDDPSWSDMGSLLGLMDMALSCDPEAWEGPEDSWRIRVAVREMIGAALRIVKTATHREVEEQQAQWSQKQARDVPTQIAQLEKARDVLEDSLRKANEQLAELAGSGEANG